VFQHEGKCVVTKYQQDMTQLRWKTFEQYDKCVSSTWKIIFDFDDWSRSTCTCPVYLKQYICKHMVAIAHINRKLVIPTSSEGIYVAAPI